jgi:ABC-type glycerol-3-phosphate transport system permease component
MAFEPVIAQPAIRQTPRSGDTTVSRGRVARVAPSAGSHVLLVALAIFAALPILWMYLGTFKKPNDLFTTVIPLHPTFDNIRAALDGMPFWTLAQNTVLMSIGVSLGQLFTGLLAAYAFACWRFRGQHALFLLVIATWLVPFQVTMLPNYVLLARLGLLNSVAGTVVPQLASAFAIVLLRQHLKSFPRELLEASRVDGNSSWTTLWKVIVPNLIPALAALEIILFVGAWNEYFWPLLVFHTPNSVLQLGMSTFLNSEGTNYGALMAAAGLATLPVLLLYIVLQRRIVNAFVRSGIK